MWHLLRYPLNKCLCFLTSSPFRLGVYLFAGPPFGLSYIIRYLNLPYGYIVSTKMNKKSEKKLIFLALFFAVFRTFFNLWIKKCILFCFYLHFFEIFLHSITNIRIQSFVNKTTTRDREKLFSRSLHGPKSVIRVSWPVDLSRLFLRDNFHVRY